jgi:hypothetical protein
MTIASVPPTSTSSTTSSQFSYSLGPPQNNPEALGLLGRHSAFGTLQWKNSHHPSAGASALPSRKSSGPILTTVPENKDVLQELEKRVNMAGHGLYPSTSGLMTEDANPWSIKISIPEAASAVQEAAVERGDPYSSNAASAPPHYRHSTPALFQFKVVVALYDFLGDEAGGELTFLKGDLLMIVRQDIGDGWWECYMIIRSGSKMSKYSLRDHSSPKANTSTIQLQTVEDFIGDVAAELTSTVSSVVTSTNKEKYLVRGLAPESYLQEVHKTADHRLSVRSANFSAVGQDNAGDSVWMDADRLSFYDTPPQSHLEGNVVVSNAAPVSKVYSRPQSRINKFLHQFSPYHTSGASDFIWSGGNGLSYGPLESDVHYITSGPRWKWKPNSSHFIGVTVSDPQRRRSWGGVKEWVVFRVCTRVR